MLRPWSQQARQLTPRRRIVAHLGNRQSRIWGIRVVMFRVGLRPYLPRWLRHGHPPGRGRWHAPSSRHLRALLSVCGGCSFGGLFLSCVCVGVGGVVLCRCVCVCDLLIVLHGESIADDGSVGLKQSYFLTDEGWVGTLPPSDSLTYICPSSSPYIDR